MVPRHMLSTRRNCRPRHGLRASAPRARFATAQLTGICLATVRTSGERLWPTDAIAQGRASASHPSSTNTISSGYTRSGGSFAWATGTRLSQRRRAQSADLKAILPRVDEDLDRAVLVDAHVRDDGIALDAALRADELRFAAFGLCLEEALACRDIEWSSLLDDLLAA
jgi:hypothetical protein